MTLQRHVLIYCTMTTKKIHGIHVGYCWRIRVSYLSDSAKQNSTEIKKKLTKLYDTLLYIFNHFIPIRCYFNTSIMIFNPHKLICSLYSILSTSDWMGTVVINMYCQTALDGCGLPSAHHFGWFPLSMRCASIIANTQHCVNCNVRNIM